MEEKESNRLKLNERNEKHKQLMVSILKNLFDTPLVLKGGTALYLCYGLNRFSEDLDFDSSKKLNLLNRIRNSATAAISIDSINIKKNTDTVSRYLIHYSDKRTGDTNNLKLEISYRTPTPEQQITIKDGIRYSSIERIIDNKLNAAFDGQNIRTVGRDLFDLHFLSTYYTANFTPELAIRLNDFASDPNKLIQLYSRSIKADALIKNLVNTEQLAYELNENARNIFNQTQRNLLSPTIFR